MEISNSEAYRKEVQEGVQIFEKSFKGAAETKKFPEKKALFERSSREALKGIGDAAKALMNQRILEEKEKLEKDYGNYLSNPTPENEQQVEKDLQSFKKTLQ